jgi:hypothetical protein
MLVDMLVPWFTLGLGRRFWSWEVSDLTYFDFVFSHHISHHIEYQYHVKATMQ